MIITRRPVLTSHAAALLCALALGACAVTPLTVGERARELMAELPATYSGTVACEGCPSVGFTLALRPDSIYFLRTRYLRSDSTAPALFDEVGRWRLAPDSGAVLLRSRPDLEVTMAIADAATLVVPRPGGVASVADSAGRTLRRASVRWPFVPRLQLRGIYTRDARGARLRDCASDLVVPVAREGAGISVDSAFAGRVSSNRAIMVHVVGRIEQRPRMEDARRTETLIVEQFNGVLPGDTCGSGLLAAEGIIGHTWKLETIGSEPLSPEERAARAWLTIAEHETRVRGRGGCNRFAGTAAIDGDRVRFSEITATKMACDAIALETRFFGALEAARRWRIVDGQLELLDAGGAVLAVFLRGAAEPE